MNFEKSNDELEDLPLEIQDAAKHAEEDLLPTKSKLIYETTYNTFVDWKTEKKVQVSNETVLLAYFDQLSKQYKPSSLWSMYSMLKSTIVIREKVDISRYNKLKAFLKKQSKGFLSKKSKVLTPENVKKFLTEAPDNKYLATKVALIFGVFGACRGDELTHVKVQDVQRNGNLLLVNIPDTKTSKPRSFTIRGDDYNTIIKRYEDLRPTEAATDRYFINYQNGKCTTQVIGKNKFSGMPKLIATFLKLPNPESYTGHSFRRTSATLLADHGADIITLKRHGGWKSSTVAEGYIEESIENKTKISNVLSSAINLPLSLNENVKPQIDEPSQSNQNLDQYKKNVQLDDESSALEQSSKRLKTSENPITVLSTSSSNADYSTLTKMFHFENCSNTITINFTGKP